MKYNDGDMDDLFRRASERYPLRTDSADWDRLSAALDGGPAAPSDGEEKRRRRGIFWWFLLIPLAGIGYWTWHVSGDHVGKAAVTHAGVVRADSMAGTVSRAGMPDAATVRGTRGGGTVGNGLNGEAGTSGSGGEESGRSMAVVDRRNLTGGRSAAGRVGGTVRLDNDAALALLDLRRAPIGGRYGVDVDVVAPKVRAQSKTPAAKKAPKPSHAYIGVFGAPDFSMVRFQSMKGVGTTFGLILGYSFNDRWAVETGLYLDRKRYYTEGEYFNTDKVLMPPGYSKLLNVDGTCDMWEIPVNVRYNFNTSQRIKWFATAGLSTYLMTSENYTYLVQNNWNTEENYWNIHKPSQYWFSIVNLSAGFERRIGKIGNLRLEPYVRIPLSGIGTGSLPIVSAGLNIGLVRQLW